VIIVMSCRFVLLKLLFASEHPEITIPGNKHGLGVPGLS